MMDFSRTVVFSQSSLLASQCGSPSCCSIRSRFAGLAFFGVASGTRLSRRRTESTAGTGNDVGIL